MIVNINPEAEVTVSTRSEKDDQPMTLGVLLVHGIGRQRRGETLLQAGGALHRWLRCWRKEDVELVDTDITSAELDPPTPAHSSLLFRDATKVSSTKLLLAECN